MIDNRPKKLNIATLKWRKKDFTEIETRNYKNLNNILSIQSKRNYKYQKITDKNFITFII
jgi:hypothetical protein